MLEESSQNSVLSSSTILCRANARKYFSWLSQRSDFIHLFEGRNFPPMKKLPGVVVWLDDHRASCCSAGPDDAYGGYRISDSSRGGENVFQWPNGFESKMVLDRPKECSLLIELARQATHAPLGHGIIDTVTGGPYIRGGKGPASGGRDDRTPMKKVVRGLTSVDHQGSRKRPFAVYLRSLREAAWSLCPEGNGFDSHRFYESYAMGAMPLVRSGVLTPLHRMFSCTEVKEWPEIADIHGSNDFVPDLKKLTVGHWLYLSLRPMCEIVQIFSRGYILQWKNFLMTARAVGIADLIVVYALDEETKKACQEEGIRTRDVTMNSVQGMGARVEFKQKYWKEVMDQKVKAVYHAVAAGKFVFYMDTDIVLFKDPLQHVFSLPACDLWVQDDTVAAGQGMGPGARNICAGCIFYAPTRATLCVLETQLRIAPRFPCDQSALNVVLKSLGDKVSVGVLAHRTFPNGFYFWGPRHAPTKVTDEERETILETAVLVHNNCLIGVEKKNARFKKHGLWYL